MKSFLRDSGTLLSGSLIAQGIAFLAYLVLGRLFTPDDFGLYNIFYSYIEVLIILSTCKYELAIVIADSDDQAAALTRLTLRLNALFSSLLLLIALLLALFHVTPSSLPPQLYLLIPPMVFFCGTTRVYTFLFNRYKHYRQIAISEVVTSLGGTLLKILSKVTGPTTGTIRARGRIGSLLEVGTGFHQEMTGRENIFLNGAILGMTKSEIARKLDEIVDFSGCERYIDTPVKRYSSGMSVRLGFAVAAFLDPEILVVDEVLAVGDAEFQKKAIGKMQDVSRSEGRTVLFVSHNMVSIQQLCHTGLLLKNGMIETSGPISDVVNIYLSNIKTVNDYNRHGNGAVKTTDFKTSATRVDVGHDIEVDFDIEAYQHVDILEAEIEIKDSNGQNLANISNTDAGTIIKPMEKGEKRHFHCLIKNINFAPGNYTANIWLGSPYATYDKVEDCIRFNVIQTEEFILRPIPYYSSYRVILQSEWDI